MARRRFRLVPTLGLVAPRGAALAALEDGLGLPRIDADDAHLAYGLGRLALYVDTTEPPGAPAGFIPMVATADLEDAVAHFEGQGFPCVPMPWAPDAPGVLVEGPGGIRFCVVPDHDVVDARARRFLDEERPARPDRPATPARLLVDPVSADGPPEAVAPVDDAPRAKGAKGAKKKAKKRPKKAKAKPKKGKKG